MRADATTTNGGETPVNLWADSVGEAAKQLGIVLTLGIAAHLASSLLSGFAKVLH
ncbi:MAG TPA: hypothetical protein VIM14_11915 [Polyangia bacterium]